MAKYNVYQGEFRCHVCKAEVKSLRSYIDDKQLTWMCPDKHVSTVNLNTKKKAKDFE
jgi:hypothetical protein